ncbi:MAG: bifunctional DNA-binding transcriptional regulator/O6-methylguanine-DNA methyltransferase Ada [Verrucomicrobiaceae bacterium]|nr:bifunctional DNA-binding transcriptional regulator/O6-methylguanine-DNA methyltransferase Ada [Verrucomicrobiaceae bacterium]
MPPKNATLFATDDERYAAVVGRLLEADGHFVYAVTTTGIFCRPSCSAKTALRKNVRFFVTPVDAHRAGFRACKRCQPDGESLDEHYSKMVAKACHRLDQCERLPALNELAVQCGMSRFHFQRIFKRVIGITPGQYHAAKRAERVRSGLTKKQSVTEAILDAGFANTAHFHSTISQQLGMKAKTYRSGGRGENIRYAMGDCTLGKVLVASSERGICAILLGDQPNPLVDDLRERFPEADIQEGDSAFTQMVEAVIRHVDTPNQTFDLPLDIRGTAFQQRVWRALMTIPPGTTATYSQLADLIGSPAAVRAVAGACAANALAVVVPCHRIVRSDGNLSGYRWGVKRKAALLAAEGAKH